MTPRNLTSIFLASLLVFNATCACASMLNMAINDVAAVGDSVATSHTGHHAEPEQTASDCLQPDCTKNCEAAAGTITRQDTGQTPSFKFELDIDDTAAITNASSVIRSTAGSTGPPPGLLQFALSTPVRRFDLQLE